MGRASAFSFWILVEKSSGGCRGFFVLFAGVFEGDFEKQGVFSWCFGGDVVVDS